MVEEASLAAEEVFLAAVSAVAVAAPGNIAMGVCRMTNKLRNIVIQIGRQYTERIYLYKH